MVNSVRFILHVDINGTITCKDSILYSDDAIEGKLHPGLFTEIYRSIEGIWEEGLPSMRFVNYVENILHPMPVGLTPEQEDAISKKREAAYATLFSRLGREQAAEWRQKYKTAFSRLQQMQNQKVFTSFIKAIEWLQQEQISFQVLLRTYGTDASFVMQEVNERLGYEFFDRKIHKLTYSEDGSFLLQLGGSETQERLKRNELADRLAKLGNCAIRDDYATWHKKGETQEWGKPFPIDPKTPSLFFDDWEGPNTTIAPFDATTGAPLAPDRSLMPPTSTFDMLLNDDAMLDAIRSILSATKK